MVQDTNTRAVVAAQLAASLIGRPDFAISSRATAADVVVMFREIEKLLTPPGPDHVDFTKPLRYE